MNLRPSLGILRHTGIGSSWLQLTSTSRLTLEHGAIVLRCNRLHIQAASTPRGIDAASRRQTDVKHLARAFRPVPLAVITVSKGKASRPAEDLAEEYAKKIQRYAAFSAVQLRTNPSKAQSIQVAREAEGAKLLQSLQPQDRVITLDEGGRAVTSEGMARLIAEAGDTGASRLVCCIGGPFGFSQAVLDRADDVIKLSDMVLNHQIARLVLMEQLYRGYTILRGEQYHH